MKKIIFWLTVLLSLAGFGYWILNRYSYLLIPPSKDIKQYLPASENTPSPLNIPSGHVLRVFADLGGMMPRAMWFDNQGTLLVSITGQGKILALPDRDADKKVDEVFTVLESLNKPHGIVTDGEYLYVAETNKVTRYNYFTGDYSVDSPKVIFELPSGGRHFTRTIRINNGKLYTSVGSSCDVCIEKDWRRSTILVSNLDGSDLKVFAKGLRNTVFFDFDRNGKIWGMDMGRDNLGDNLPPEELNIISEGGDYGWPYCYSNMIKDTKFDSDVKNSCINSVPPVYELPAHSAPLGITFDGAGDLLVALHGSWNSSVPVGYKIVKFSVFGDGVSSVSDYISGFINSSGEIMGRPVDLKYDMNDNLFISDDKSGLIYILSKS